MDNRTPLIMSVIDGSNEVFSELLARKDIDVNENIDGLTALYWACELGKLEQVQQLLKAGAYPTIIARFKIDGSNILYQQTPLITAIHHHHHDVAVAIITFNPACLNIPSHDGLFPVHQAVLNRNYELTKFICSQDKSQLNKKCRQQNFEAVTPLYLAARIGSTRIISLLLEHGADYQQCGEKDSQGGIVSPLQIAAQRCHVESVERLLSFPHDYAILRKTLHYVYTKALEPGDAVKRQDLLYISEMVKTRLESFPKNRVLGLDDNQHTDWISSYYFLFSVCPSYRKASTPCVDKDSAIRDTLAHMHDLLRHPRQCIPYIEFLNQELRRHWQKENPHQPFPVFDRNMMDICILDDMHWPIPNDRYKSVKKHKLLSRILLNKFKQYGMGENQFKWTGFIPSIESNKLLLNNAFFNENRKTIAGLFHGNIHNIQRVILLLAIENKRIPLTYFSEDGSVQELQPKEIFSALVRTDLNRLSNTTIWGDMLDSVKVDCVYFSHPQRMHSVLMTEAEFAGPVQDFLLFGFCDQFLEMRNLHNHVYKTNYSNSDMIGQLEKLTLYIFSGVIEFALQRDELSMLEDIVTMDKISKRDKTWMRQWKTQDKTYLPLSEEVGKYSLK